MLKKISVPLIMLSLVALPIVASAAATPTVPVEGTPINSSDIRLFVNDAINVLVTIASLLVVGVFIYAGLLWVTAGDNEAKVKKAKTMLRNAVIGAIVVFGVGVILNTIADFARAPTEIFRY